MSKVVKVLIVRFSSIGDIVLTTPVVRCLKRQLPNVEVHFCTKLAYGDIVSNNPFVDKCHFLTTSVAELVGRLRKEKFDYVVDLHNNYRTKLLKLALNTRSFTVDKLNIRKWLYVHLKADVMPESHLVKRYLATVLALGVKDDALGLDFFISPNDYVDLHELPLTHRSGYVAYAIGGQHRTKRLPTHRMVELCRKIGSPITLLGGKEDRQSGEEVVEAVGSGLVYNACGQYSLSQSASLLQQATVVFSHDTGLMHIAAAFGKKVYSIWGNTTPKFGMYPYKTPYVVLEKEGLECRPCSKLGFDACPAGHFNCMNELAFTFEVSHLRANDTVV